jgi:hypothetical protein
VDEDDHDEDHELDETSEVHGGNILPNFRKGKGVAFRARLPGRTAAGGVPTPTAG